MTSLPSRIDDAWQRRARRPFGLDLAALVFVLGGLALSVAGGALVLRPELHLSAEIAKDRYVLTGLFTGVILLAVGVATLVGFVAAYEVRSYRLILGPAACHAALAAYGFATTGQMSALLFTLFVLAAVWSARRTATAWWG
ncbi:MAG: hypothetical protein ABUL57_03015 [Chloroflexota bacterium]